LILVDTHAHLDSARFQDDLQDAISRAVAAGVQAIITVGSDIDSSHAAVTLAQQHPSVYATVGVHPHDASHVRPDDLTQLKRLCQHPKVVAIGETGLDFYRNLSPRARQREAFVAQLELARELNKPVVIHDRDAHAELLAILQRMATGWRGVLHCFSGDYEMAKAVIEMGFYLSFAGPVTFHNAKRLQAMIPLLPLERLLIETDCPYLTPHPHRGQRNEPANVSLVAAKIAELKALPVKQVAEVTTANAKQLFGLPSLG
jgi:TatD DNase family protein